MNILKTDKAWKYFFSGDTKWTVTLVVANNEICRVHWEWKREEKKSSQRNEFWG